MTASEAYRRKDAVQVRRIWLVVLAAAAIQVTIWRLAAGPSQPLMVLVLTGWFATLVVAVLATRRIRGLSKWLDESEQAHRAAVGELEQLRTQNAMLDIVARSVDVPLTFQALAGRIARLVPCDRVGLALLTDRGDEFRTYTARVHENERQARLRPDLVFKVERTAIGHVVRTLKPMVVRDMKAAALDFLDANVIETAGFQSGIVVPLVSNGRAIGTLNVVARREDALTDAHVDVLRPIAEILAIAQVAQQLHMGIAKYRTTEVMSDLMLSIAAEINSALQVIVGTSDLLLRAHSDQALRRDLATIVSEAQRVTGLLDKMRASARERLKEATSSVDDSAMPADRGPLT